MAGVPEEEVVCVPTGSDTLEGSLIVPDGAVGNVLFVHGSGSSGHSPGARYVARLLNASGFVTLLIDLLTYDEEAIDLLTADMRLNIDLIAQRVLDATRWLRRPPGLEQLPVGYFGADTGAAAALMATTTGEHHVHAVVSCGGRPDLVAGILPSITTPTLLVAGENDPTGAAASRAAFGRLGGEQRLVIIPGARHLLEEAGPLDEVARRAREWFELHLGGMS
jgi:putative phosphoribosyl transferase